MEPPVLPDAMVGQPFDAAPVRLIPLVPQVSPLLGSADQEEYFYDPSPDVHHGPFAATREFFLAQGHEVDTLECPDIAAFQAIRPPRVSFTSLADLPPRVFTEGYAILQELALAAIAGDLTVNMPDAPPDNVVQGVAATSLHERYATIPLVSSLGPSQLAVAGHPPSGSLPSGPPSFIVRGVSRRPDPDGINVCASLASSLQVRLSQYGGYSFRLYHHDGRFGGVSPLRHHGGASVSLAAGIYGGLPHTFQGHPSVGFFPDRYRYGGSLPLADGVPHDVAVHRVPQVVYGGQGPPRPGLPHAPASVGPHQSFPFPGARLFLWLMRTYGRPWPPR